MKLTYCFNALSRSSVQEKFGPGGSVKLHLATWLTVSQSWLKKFHRGRKGWGRSSLASLFSRLLRSRFSAPCNTLKTASHLKHRLWAHYESCESTATWGRKRRERKDEGRNGWFSRERNIRGRLWLTDSFYDLDLGERRGLIPADPGLPRAVIPVSWKWITHVEVKLPLPQKEQGSTFDASARAQDRFRSRIREESLNERAQAVLKRNNCFGRVLSNLALLFLNKVIPSQGEFGLDHAWD